MIRGCGQRARSFTTISARPVGPIEVILQIVSSLSGSTMPISILALMQDIVAPMPKARLRGRLKLLAFLEARRHVLFFTLNTIKAQLPTAISLLRIRGTSLLASTCIVLEIPINRPYIGT